MHATSTDRKTWTKHPEDTFYAPENYSRDDFRDPEVFWMEEDGCSASFSGVAMKIPE